MCRRTAHGRWARTGGLASPTGFVRTLFGYTVAISGNDVFVGAELTDNAFVDAGEAFAADVAIAPLLEGHALQRRVVTLKGFAEPASVVQIAP